LALFLVILVALFFHFRRFRGCLEATGLPMVPPFLCFGSPPRLFNKIVYHEWYLEKHRELGHSFTRYEGVTPIICTIDPEFIKEVTVKQFDNFTDVVDIEFSPGQTTLDVARGDTWRALRKLLSPTFTSGKIKSMVEPMEGFWPEGAVQIRKMTKDIIKERDEKNIQVGDFVDRLRGFKKVAVAPITDEMIEAQGMVFLLAGFETTASTLSSLIYHVAMYPEVQEKIIEEIRDNIGSDDITHESISTLEYLEACIMETLRVCPTPMEHDRTCVNDCIVNGIKVKKGVRIMMPTLPAHLDPEFFPEPEKYQPERFLKENAANVIPYTWRPFGSGNRVCIAQRFAMMEMKLFFAKFMAKFKLIPTEKSGLVPEPGNYAFFMYNESIAKVEPRTLVEE